PDALPTELYPPLRLSTRCPHQSVFLPEVRATDTSLHTFAAPCATRGPAWRSVVDDTCPQVPPADFRRRAQDAGVHSAASAPPPASEAEMALAVLLSGPGAGTM